MEIFKIHSSSRLRYLLDLIVFKDLRPDSLVGVLPDLLCELHTSKATLLSPAPPRVDLYQHYPTEVVSHKSHCLPANNHLRYTPRTLRSPTVDVLESGLSHFKSTKTQG